MTAIYEAAEQMRIIKDLLSCNFHYMELRHFTEAMNIAIKNLMEAEPDSDAQRGWHKCCGAISMLAVMRFGFTAWINHLLSQSPQEHLSLIKGL